MSESVCLCVILFPLQLIMYQTQTLAGGDRLSDIQSGYIQTRTSGTNHNQTLVVMRSGYSQTMVTLSRTPSLTIETQCLTDGHYL